MQIYKGKINKVAYAPTILDSTRDWLLAADLRDGERYPELIRKTGLSPDLVLHSAEKCQLIMTELTVSTLR